MKENYISNIVDDFIKARKRHMENLDLNRNIIADSLGLFLIDYNFERYALASSDKENPIASVIYSLVLEDNGKLHFTSSKKAQKLTAAKGNVNSSTNTKVWYEKLHGLKVKCEKEIPKITVDLGSEMKLIHPLRSEPYSDLDISIAIFMIIKTITSVSIRPTLEEYPMLLDEREIPMPWTFMFIAARGCNSSFINNLMWSYNNTIPRTTAQYYLSNHIYFSSTEFQRLKKLVDESKRIFVRERAKICKELGLKVNYMGILGGIAL